MTTTKNQVTTTSKSEPAALSLYNFRSRQIEPLRPLGETVGLYTCGPTVYGPAHIGNFRTFIFEDVLRRVVRGLGYPLTQVMNITDVEDKIIAHAAAAGIDIQTFTAPHERQYMADLAALMIEPAEHYPRATEHIPEMIELIRRLEERGLAYPADDGSVYFAIRKFPQYGRLAGIDVAQLKSGARVAQDEYDKDSAEDFVLWKAAKPEDEAVGAVWDSPWGRGRPGWHIECSAMGMKYLGESFDLHAGGIDLLFPHHEDEIAQSEGATGQTFTQFVLEAEHLLVEGEKMAKSAGNFVTLAEIERRGIDPVAFRYLMLTAHYRAKLNFTWDSLAAAAETVRQLRDLMYRPAAPIDDELRQKIWSALATDLNTPQALGLLHTAGNPALWAEFDAVLGLGLMIESVVIPAHVRELMDAREVARQARDFAKADTLRNQIFHAGFAVEDTPDGPVVLPRTSSRT